MVHAVTGTTALTAFTSIKLNLSHLVVALDRWIVCQISGHGRGDDVVRAADQASHECEEKKEDGDWNLIHVLSEHPQ
jgi:hypothetical protein